MLPVCFILRLVTHRGQDRVISILRMGLLGLQGSIGIWGALGGHRAELGPLVLDSLSACWIILWTLTRLSPHKSCGAVGEASGGIGLLCHDHALSLICFMPCLIENWHLSPHPPAGRWRLGLLAPAGCGLAVMALFPGLNVLTPLAGLATLPAFFATPVLAYSLFVPALLAQNNTIWAVILTLLGAGLCLTLPVRRVLTFWPLLLLGLTLAARAGGLADSALAGSEAFILALALNGLDGKTTLFQTPLPALAGFLPFWLGLHVVSSLTDLTPAWTAGGMILSLTIGVLMVRAWLASWQTLASWQAWPPVSRHASPEQAQRNVHRVQADFALPERGLIPALTFGLCLSICPGLLIGLLHGAALFIAGASPGIWRSWPMWSVAGGDGAFWYPALVFLIPALIVPAVITHVPSFTPPLPAWPSATIRLRLPWAFKRILASGRRQIMTTRRVWQRYGSKNEESSPDALQHRADMFLTRQALALWLLLLAIALSWMGWTT